MITRILTTFSFVLLTLLGNAQNKELQLLDTGTHTNIRGMSVKPNNIIWVSGSNGTVGRSVNGGQTWKWMIVPGFEKRDFRDIEAFDSSTAIIMGVDNPSVILKTTDGGNTWKTTFYKEREGMFLDAMDFKNEKEGICIGDPVNEGPTARKALYVIRTYDGGETWTEGRWDRWPPAEQEEAIFAASGTSISFLEHPDFEYAFVTGGKVAKLYMIGRDNKASKIIDVPINKGIFSTGIFSLATDGKNKFYCIGGDYAQPTNLYANLYYSTDGGSKWVSPSAARPLGYRSCIKIIDDKQLIACGTTGVDLSNDGGKHWKSVSTLSFNVCMVTPDKKSVFLAGERGKIARIDL